MSIRVNEKGLIYLNEETMTAIFDCVFGTDGGGLRTTTKQLLWEPKFRDFVKTLNGLQEYNYRYRIDQVMDLFPIFESAIGPFEFNSEGTTLWLAMGLAIKEVYGFRRSSLEELLKLVKIKK
ncbi:MAG TPA: hypothetical protein GXX18_08575 [Bacillales bacterium]|nr:hypothetical protein [Bacillales bacterium]